MKKILIHIPKTAGRMLSKYAETTDTYSTHKYEQHARYQDLHKNYRNNKEFFAVVRNPWSRKFSEYLFVRHRLYNLRRSPSVGNPNISLFEEYLINCSKRGRVKKPFWNWKTMKEYVVDEEGNVSCKILRFENLKEDAERYLGLTDTATIGASVKRGGTPYDYRDFYTDRTKALVAEKHQEDLELFGYTFESGPTNILDNFEINR